MENKQEAGLIITKVWAKNFRSLEDVELKLGPLTVLVGPNASGKSNTVDTLRFVADALRMELDAAITARHGIGALRRWSAKGRPYDIEIGLRAGGSNFSIEYSFVLASGLHGQYKVKREHATAEFGGLYKTLPPQEFEVKDGHLTKPPIDAKKNGEKLSLFPGISPPTEFESTSLAFPIIRRMPCFYRPLRVGGRRNVLLLNPFSQLYAHLTKMRFYHIFPPMLREPQKPGNPYPLDEHGENLASVLREMIRSNSPYLPDLRDALSKVVPGVCDVQVSQVGGYLVGKLKHEGAEGDGSRALFDLSQESDGTLRLIGLLVALFQHPSPSLIAIEEPELTIHPGALAVLADLLREATRRTQILVTTHSPDLIDRISVEDIRAVEVISGVTTVAMVADHQREAVRTGLFSPGELHRMEGLKQAEAKA